MKYVGLDLGASSGKIMSAQIVKNKLVSKILYRFPNQSINLNGALYWDILNISKQMFIGLEKAMYQDNEPICFGIDSFCNDFGIIGKNGHLISQVRCYRDLRMINNRKIIYEKVPREVFYRITGNQIAPFNTSMEMASMAMEEDSALLQSGNHALFIPNLLIYFLSGNLQTEYTLASVSQLLEYKTGCWSSSIMKKLGIPLDIFPPIYMPGTISGTLSHTLNADLPSNSVQLINVGGHDTASAVASLPDTDKHVAYISSGTWSLVGTEVSAPIINQKSFKQNIAFEGGVEQRYRMIKNVMGLWILQEVLREFKEKKNIQYSYDFIVKEASSAKPLESIIDPDDPSFFIPGKMIEKIQFYCRKTNQKLPTGIGEISRCIFESLAIKYRIVMTDLEDILGYRLKRIYILGGGGQNHLLNQLVANACDREVISGLPDAALLGNIITQMTATGELKNISEGRDLIRNSYNFNIFTPVYNQEWDNKYNLLKTLLLRKKSE